MSGAPFPIEEGVWQQQYAVLAHHADFQKQLTAGAICRLFMDAAWNHAEALGVGYEALAREGMLWVLSRLSLEFWQLPQWGEQVWVRTWPRLARSVVTARDFELLNAQGSVCASGTSAWLVLDAVARKPQRMEEIASRIRPVCARKALGREPAKVPPLPVRQPGLNVKVRYSDIDVNGHANSARYIEWVLDSYPLDWHRQNQLSALDMNYMAETRDGDTLGINCDHSLPGGHLYALTVLRGEMEALRARLCWTTRKSSV